MAGDANVIVGAQPVEYAEEIDFATELAEDTEYEWFGISTSWSAEQGVESESITYLPEFGAENKLEKNVNVKLREMYEGDITYHPQTDFDFLQYWTGEVGGTNDDVPTIQVGEIDETNDEYRRLLGGVGEEFTLSVEEDGVAEIDGSFMFADATDWESEDYVGEDGSHAEEDTTEPWSFDDLGEVLYGGEEMDGSIESVEVTVSNDIAEVRDPNVDRGTQLSALVPVDREINVDVEFTYENFDILEEVRAYEPKDFEFTLGDTTFTIEGVQFPEVPYEFTPDDLISDSLSSDRASSITWE